MPNLLGPFIFGAIATCALKLLRGKKVTLGSAILGGIVFIFIWPLATATFVLTLKLLLAAALIIVFLFLAKNDLSL